MRSGWTINGQHFTETRTERGGLRYFIDGKPTTRDEWQAAIARARADAARITGKVAETKQETAA